MVFLGVAPDEERMKAVAEVIGLPGNLKAFGMFPLGYPDEKREQENRYKPEKIHYITEDMFS
jgi:hypothetical protein